MLEHPNYSAIQDATEQFRNDRMRESREALILLCEDAIRHCKKLEAKLKMDSRMPAKFTRKLNAERNKI